MNAVRNAPVPVTRYELPPEGITLLGYVVRRMHKTAWLLPVSSLLAAGQTAEALAQIALYAAAASASFGPAYYQPTFNPVGDTVSEVDPATGAVVTATLEARSPHYCLSYSAELPEGSRFTGEEEITGTTVSLNGLGMPAPSRFNFTTATGVYTAQVVGTIVSELLPSWPITSRIRAHGTLDLRDSAQNRGTLQLRRSGDVLVELVAATGAVVVRRERWLAANPGAYLA